MEELTEISQEIKDLRRLAREHRVLMNKARADLNKIENRYKLAYAFNDWNSKVGKYFKVFGFEEDEILYCNVLEVDETGFTYEYIMEADGYFSVEKVTDMTQDCDYRQWIEITMEEYSAQKIGKVSA